MRNTRLFKIVLFVMCYCSAAVAQHDKQAAQLTIAASAKIVRSDEALGFEVSLRNISKESFYVSGTINTALLEPYGNYDLEIKPAGEERYQTTTKVSSDPFPIAYGTPPSLAEFRAKKNVVLLQPKQFFGIQLSGTWRGLTAMPPGKYDVRIVYTASEHLPVTFDRPFLTGVIVSNVMQIEVIP